MKYLILLPLIALSACSLLPSDAKLADIEANRVAYVCSHQQAVTTAANLAIKEADNIKDPALRNAAKAVAQANLDTITTCKP